MPYKHFQGR